MLGKAVFAKQIRQALENIHDGAYLQNLPLTAELSGTGSTLDQAMRHLRAELLAAIDSLKPLGSISPRSREARPYVLMYGRYVQCATTAEMVDELAISVRQLRREHKRALDAFDRAPVDQVVRPARRDRPHRTGQRARERPRQRPTS